MSFSHFNLQKAIAYKSITVPRMIRSYFKNWTHHVKCKKLACKKLNAVKIIAKMIPYVIFRWIYVWHRCIADALQFTFFTDSENPILRLFMRIRIWLLKYQQNWLLQNTYSTSHSRVCSSGRPYTYICNESNTLFWICFR